MKNIFTLFKMIIKEFINAISIDLEKEYDCDNKYVLLKHKYKCKY